MARSQALKTILETHVTDLDTHTFDPIVRDAIRGDILDELLDAFYRIEITIPPEVVTKELYNFYILRVAKTQEERDRYKRKINYLINKHQNVIVKTLDAPQK